MKRLKLVILPKLYDADGDVGELWFIYYSYRNPRSGKMQRFKIYKGFKGLNKKDRYTHADKLIAELTDDIKRGWTPFDRDDVIYEDNIQYSNVAKVYGNKRKGNLTLTYFINEYLNYKKNLISKKSFSTVQSKIRIFAQWLDREGFGTNDISTLNEAVILNFFDFLIEERKLQGRTIEKYGLNIRMFFKFLLDRKKIFINPMPPIPKLPNRVDNSAKPIRHGDVALFKEIIKKNDPQLWLAIQFQFYCFTRPGQELRLMKLNWIDFYSGTITIPAYMEYNGENIPIAKNKETITISIPQQFLNELIQVYSLDKFDKNLFVFGNSKMPGNTPLGKNNLTRRFNNFRDALNLNKEYKFYSWKPTGGISAHRAGVPIKDIQMQMRHKDLSITDAYFKRLLPQDSIHLKNKFPSI